MPYVDLHDKPFDDTTIAKLEIFEDYAEAWLPTFIWQNSSPICIFDFFAGTGYDKNGVEGSPIRLLKIVQQFVTEILKRKLKVRLYLNEYQPGKFALLQESVDSYIKSSPDLSRAVELRCHNEDFELLFPKLLPVIEHYPALVYLDQNGVKFLSDKYFLPLERTRQTDFLYFISSSYFWRFGDRHEFKQHLNIDMEAAKKDPYRFIHRNILDQLRKKLPTDSQLMLYPFSLKKGANIHGIIFGASHILAVQKFLSLAWKRNDKNGEANFDLDEDAKKAQGNLFGEQKLTKIDSFKTDFRNLVLNGKIRTNKQAFDYVMREGHIGTHAADCLRQMKREKLIDYDNSHPLVTYDNTYKTPKLLNYTILKK